MGYFKNISFLNFRNFDKSIFQFDASCNIIIGKNGVGKTNILEALSLFEKGRGFKKEKINNLINYHSKNLEFSIQSIFVNEEMDMNIRIFNLNKTKKKITVNNSDQKDSVNYFESLFSIIYFLPEMERIFLASPSLRRNFLDRLIYNQDKSYSNTVINYRKSLAERQILLKGNYYDENWIQKLEYNICDLGSIIYKKRLNHIEKINKILKEITLDKSVYKKFSIYLKDDFIDNNHEIYNDNDKYLLKLNDNRKNDLFSGGCVIGPHRSDLSGQDLTNNFNLNQLSTGQQKTIVLLIIIAQCKILIDSLNLNPIILLDEICSHLDDVNRELLLYLIEELKVQVFMTGTDKSFFSFLSTKSNYCNIN